LAPSATAAHFGGDAWLKLHEAHVKSVQANQGAVDVLLVGDSISIQWGDSWKKHFQEIKVVNIGIGGDKTQNVLWRLDHGGVEGLQPKVIVLMIGKNNMFFTPETGIEAAALGIQICMRNLREKFPAAVIIGVPHRFSSRQRHPIPCDRQGFVVRVQFYTDVGCGMACRQRLS
jgi:platelet-activating factor acetylhydrolase IB subunit beta/gamma